MSQAQLLKKYRRETTNLVNILKKYKPEKIILFGSVAHGAVREGSDIDLCLIKKFNGPAISEYPKIYDLLWANKYHYTIEPDLKIYHSGIFEKKLKEEYPFVKEIIDSGQVVYEKQ